MFTSARSQPVRWNFCASLYKRSNAMRIDETLKLSHTHTHRLVYTCTYTHATYLCVDIFRELFICYTLLVPRVFVTSPFTYSHISCVMSRTHPLIYELIHSSTSHISCGSVHFTNSFTHSRSHSFIYTSHISRDSVTCQKLIHSIIDSFMCNKFLVTRLNVRNNALIHQLINLFTHRKLAFLLREKERERGGVHSWYGVATVSRID